MGFLKFLRFRMRRKRVAAVADDGCSSSSSSMDGGVLGKSFTWEDMKRVTKNFSKTIGLGGFSTVYLAEFPENSTRGAVKVVHGSSCSERLNRIYKQELEIFLCIRHPNIVNLLGYCDDDRQEGGVLVFDYVSNGSLHDKLHCDNGSLLSWKSRVLIAFQVAHALDYLHDKSGLHIIHGDIKVSNILLDENLNCKLCDLGSAKMGFASTVLPPSCSRMEQTMMGSDGYMDPHYLKTGIVSKKNDIYSFGVVLLELVTGVDALCLARGKMLKSIPNRGSTVLDGVKVAEMVDSRLKNEVGFDMEEARAMVSISAMCISQTPMLRPCASQILTSMREKFSSIPLQQYS